MNFLKMFGASADTNVLFINMLNKFYHPSEYSKKDEPTPFFQDLTFELVFTDSVNSYL